MKNIIKLTCLLLTVCGFAGCTGNFDEYNTDPYALYKGDPAVLIPTMLDAMMYVQQNDSQMVDQMVGSLGGYFTLSNRWGGQNFDTFNASDAWNAHAVQHDVRGYLRQLLRHREIDQQVGPLLRDGPSGARRSDDARRRLLRPDPLQQGSRRLVLCRVRLGGGCLQAYHRGPRGRGDHALCLCAGVSGVETAG